jgi:hypothetical protein
MMSCALLATQCPRVVVAPVLGHLSVEALESKSCELFSKSCMDSESKLFETMEKYNLWKETG